MKRLYLIRHAKSSWEYQDLPDFERPLNDRGKHDAPVMAKRLKHREVQPDLIVSSPAKRALKTVKILAKELGYPKKQIVLQPSVYEASVTTLLMIVKQLDDAAQEVMLVGHNPGMTDFVNLLADMRLDNLPTCGIVCLDCEIQSWKELAEGTGRLVFFDSPKI